MECGFTFQYLNDYNMQCSKYNYKATVFVATFS